MIDLNVNIKEKEKNYHIFIESSDIYSFKDKIVRYINGKNFIVVFSEKVYKLFGKVFNFNKDNIYILKDGENQKNLKSLKKILDFCQKRNLKRDDCIIAIGGGVAGDITGLAASLYMRGINFIQVPTTLLACVDSSVGGKTAVNTCFGKNIIGTFYQPNVVFINTNLLKTLDDRNFKTGLGEVVKYAFIEKSCLCDIEYDLINFLDKKQKLILAKDPKTLEKLIEICICLKISVVEKDEKESSLRKILNFGHTYGHAIELFTKYKKYTHGECVVAGIQFAFSLALENNLIDKNYLFFMQDILKLFNFKYIPQPKLNKLIKLMKNDKKANHEFIRFILPVDYAVVKEFDLNEMLTIS